MNIPQQALPADVAPLTPESDLRATVVDLLEVLLNKGAVLNVDMLIGIGEPARDYDPDQLVAGPEEAAELLAEQLESGDLVLVKGSRSAGLEAVAESLQALMAEANHG